MSTAPIPYGSDEPLPSPGFASDRALAAFRDLVRACLPQLALLGVWEYRVDAVASSTSVDCSPLDPSLGLPGAVRATLQPSILGERVTPSVGSVVLVAFVNGNAARPIVIAGDPNATPSAATLLGGTAYAARVGDGVTLSIAQLNASGANIGGTPVTWPSPIQATIASGSTKVKVG
jgi:hypothetical protein